MLSYKRGFTALPIVLVFGCSLHQVQEQVAPPEFTPETYSESGKVPVPERWWTVFEDAELNDLTGQALAGNLDLAAAWARLQQFDALARQAGAARLPSVNGSVLASRGRSLGFAGTQESNFFDLGVDAGYEIDLFKKISATSQASLLDYQASRQDLESIGFAISGGVARSWFGLVEQRQQLALLAEQVEVNEKFLEVIETRFTNGAASAVDVFQQREQLASIRSQIPRAQASLALFEHQLAVLTGKAPKTPSPSQRQTLPELPALPTTGVPADLLVNRPDVRARMLRLMAADFRLGAAIANRYPSLRLSASTGFQANKVGDLFSNWVWNLASSLMGPIFDGGRLKAEVDRNQGVLAERLAGFEATVLDAMREVEDALVLEHHQHELIERLQEQLNLARKAHEAGQARYLRGVGSFLILLTETQAVQRVERALLSARLALVSYRIDLYLALGGTWTGELQKAEMTFTEEQTR